MARLYLSLFGGFEARLDDTSLTGFTTDKARALLVFLVMEMRRPLRRQLLASLFWPDYTEASARASLRHALANLRHVLKEPYNPIPFLLVSGETIQFNPGSDYQVDVLAFQSLAAADNPDYSNFQNLEQAVDLYRGSFLEGFSLKDSAEFDSWSSITREELHQQVLDALYRLGEGYAVQGKLENAQKAARRQLELEPWREEAHRQTMRLMVMAGERTAALAQYAACQKALKDELSVEPSETTRSLYEQIRAGTAVVRVESPGEAPIPSALPGGKQRNNLPFPTTSFIGREEEITTVSSLLSRHRLVTLTGAGGVGKTSLSIHSGYRVLDRFADGVFFVDLAPLTNPDLVPQAVASALGIHVIQDNLVDTLLFALCSRNILLVLDNCEHLLDICGALSEKLLKSCPLVKVLVTSRIPLGLRGEAIYRVPSLAYPEPSQKVTVQNLLDFPAVRLLVERARLFKQDLQVTRHNLPALVRICQQLDGIPLALELAAARIHVLTVEEVAGRLEDAFRLLTGGARTALLRHQTLRATIEWSYNLLQEKERLLLNRLAVFSESCTLEAVEAVCANDGIEASEILDLLTNLVNQSMVNARQNEGEETRYSLLQTVRTYADEKLSAEEWKAQSARHCQYYLWLAEQAEPRLRSAERLVWTRKMKRENNNIEQALEWAYVQGDHLAVIRIVTALAGRFWQPHQFTRQTIFWTNEAIKLAQNMPDLPPLLLVRVLNYKLTNEYSGPEVDKAVALCHEIGSQAERELVMALSNAMDFSRYNNTALRAYCADCLETARRLRHEDVWYQAWAYFIAGFYYANNLAEYHMACQYALEGWRLFQQSGDRWMASHLFILGYSAAAAGEYKQARALYQEGFLIHLEVEDLWGMMFALGYLAELALREGGQDRARHAARLLGASEAVGFWPDKAEWREEKWDKVFPEAMKTLRRCLPADEIDAAWSEGASMAVEEVNRYIMESRY